MKLLLIGLSFALLALLTMMPAFIVAGMQLVVPFVNGFFVLLLLFQAVSMTVEGVQVMKLIKSMEVNSNSNTQDVLQAITKLVVGSSGVLITIMLILIIATLARLSNDDSQKCLISQLVYRFSEIAVIAVLAIPLRTVEGQSLPSSPGISLRPVSYKTESGQTEM